MHVSLLYFSLDVIKVTPTDHAKAYIDGISVQSTKKDIYLFTKTIISTNQFHKMITTQTIHKQLESQFKKEQESTDDRIRQQKGQGTDRCSKNSKPVEIKT